MDQIRPPDVLGKIVEPLERQGKIEKARRVVQRIEAVCSFARAAGIMTTANPCTDLHVAMKPKPRVKPRPALMELTDLRIMIQKLEASPCHAITRLATRFIALTVMRPGNVNKAEWNEIQRDCWVIPEHKMKAGRPFSVPLSRQAQEVLDVLHPLSGGGRYLFPNGRSTLSPMSENALTYYLNRAGYQHLHCAHGWRSSFSSIMNLRYPAERHIIDFALAHSPKDRVESAYNRAEYFDRRREHLQEWADLILEGQVPLNELLQLRSR
jgi:integrase